MRSSCARGVAGLLLLMCLSVRAAASTTIIPVVGFWTSTADSTREILIREIGAQRIHVSAGDSAHAEPVYGVLRLEWRDENTLEARFSDDLAGGATRREIWTRRTFGRMALPGRAIPRPVATAAPPVLPDAGGPLPKFGDYVYVEELPEAVVRVPPAYPGAAREQGIEGTVLIQALVGRDGRVHDTRISPGKSIPALDAAAVACVRQWQFKPAMAKGVPVAVWVAIPVKFSLH